MTNSHSDKAIAPQTPEQAESAAAAAEAEHWLAVREAEVKDIQQAEAFAEFFVRIHLDIDREEAALKEFIQKRKDALLRRKNWLYGKHGERIREVAKALASRGRGKFYDTPAGRIGFRAEKSGVVKWDDKDDATAMAWVTEHLPEFVEIEVREKVRKTGLYEAMMEWSKANGGCLPDWAKISGETETMYVK